MRGVERRRCRAVRDGDRHVPVAVLVEDHVAGPGVGERPRGDGVVALPDRRRARPASRGRRRSRSMSSLRQVQRDVAEAVDVEHRRQRRCRRSKTGSRQLEPDERVGRERWPELLERRRRSRGGRRRARRGRGRETCARSTAAHRRGSRARAPRRSRPAPRPAAAARCRGRRTAGRRCLAGRRAGGSPPTPGSTTARCTPTGMYGQRVRQHERALEDRLWRDAVGDVDHPRVGRDPGDDAVAGADEVVLQPEVAEEADDHRSRLAGGLRRATRPPRRATSPSRSCVSASASTSTPASRAARVVSGPDRDRRDAGAERREGARGGRRGEHDEVAVGRSLPATSSRVR